MSPSWANDAVFYHIYPLGLCSAPLRNDFQSAPQPRLDQLYPWLDHIQSLGADTLYLGPLFESTAHGYDTADYYHVDRRLGTRQTLAAFSAELHRRSMRLVLDGVFNHVGRHFWAFRDLLANREHSAYRDWFSHLDFSRSSPFGDSFSYEGWSGNYDLVKLELANPAVRKHLFGAVQMWVEEFQIDGLRLDAADVLAPDFLQALAGYTRSLRSDFWLMGEIVHGDYRRLANPAMLDSTTNYEVYKSLYSAHVDRNYFELAYALNRQSGPGGLYSDLALYNFADNHDVNRVASNLKVSAHLYPLHILLFSMPGIPSIYYGSEWGIEGRRTASSDAALRPALDLTQAESHAHGDLAGVISRLTRIRCETPALRRGDYQQLHVASEQFAFLRCLPDQQVVVAVNASEQPNSLDLSLPIGGNALVDLLNPGNSFPIQSGKARVENIPATWGRILLVK